MALKDKLARLHQSLEQANNGVFPNDQLDRRNEYQKLIDASISLLRTFQDVGVLGEAEEEERTGTQPPPKRSVSTAAMEELYPARPITDIVHSIPKFDGNVLNWYTFRSCFEPAVVDNPNLLEYERRGLLMQSLVDEGLKFARRHSRRSPDFFAL